MKTTVAGLQSGEDCIMINIVVCAQCINVTDTQRDRQTRHVATEMPHQHTALSGKNWLRFHKVIVIVQQHTF